jgi:hypothetical protein
VKDQITGGDKMKHFVMALGLVMVVISLAMGATAENKRSIDEALWDEMQSPKFKIPKTPQEDERFNAACHQGPKNFLSWARGKEYAEKFPETWEKFGFSKDAAAEFCLDLTDNVRMARAINIPEYNTAPKSALERQRREWKQITNVYNAQGWKINAGTRIPTNDKEIAELNAAAKKGRKACADWVAPGEDHSELTGDIWEIDDSRDRAGACMFLAAGLHWKQP